MSYIIRHLIFSLSVSWRSYPVSRRRNTLSFLSQEFPTLWQYSRCSLTYSPTMCMQILSTFSLLDNTTVDILAHTSLCIQVFLMCIILIMLICCKYFYSMCTRSDISGCAYFVLILTNNLSSNFNFK